MRVRGKGVANGYRTFWGDENILKLIGTMFVQPFEYTKNTELYILKELIVRHVNYIQSSSFAYSLFVNSPIC